MKKEQKKEEKKDDNFYKKINKKRCFANYIKLTLHLYKQQLPIMSPVGMLYNILQCSAKVE